MALGDGIRRNVAKISQEERNRLIQAFLQLDSTLIYPGGVTYWDKQEDIHKNAHAAGQDVHQGPAFAPWHRELCSRLEALLRKVDPGLSLHYWDWTTDPRASDNGVGGVTNLFNNQFMGGAQGDAGAPLATFESTEPGHNFIWRSVAGGNAPPSPPPLASDLAILNAANGVALDTQFEVFNQALQNAHNIAHGYIGGTLGGQHFSFHDPFVFLLHSNMDRLWSLWQRAPGQSWRLDPNSTYGRQGGAASITGPLQPWAGDDANPPLQLRPWAPPDNQQFTNTSKDLDVVVPPLYDDYLRQIVHLACGGTPQGDLHICALDESGKLIHTIRFTGGNWQRFWGDVQTQIPQGPVIRPIARVACSGDPQGNLHVCAVDKDAKLWHTIRFTGGNWQPFWGDVQTQIPQGPDIRPLALVACGATGAQDLHVCAVDHAGKLWHTVRFAAGNWQPSWGDVQTQLPQGPDIRPIQALACAATPQDDLHVCALDQNGTLWHTIRFAAGNWQPLWGDVQSQIVQGPDIRPIARISCGATPQGDLQICSTDQSGNVWHTIRFAAGNWQPFWGNVQGVIPQGPDIRPAVLLACGGAGQGDLHVCVTDQANVLWHTIRFSAGNWQAFWGNVQNQIPQAAAAGA
jgi:hypothetical protein